MFIHTGDYIEHKKDAPLQSTYYTFTPRPLMGEGFYTMTDELSALIASAHRSMGILEGVLFSFYEKEMLAEMTMLKESCFNKMIDYSDFDFNSEILNLGLGKSDEDINNISSAYHQALGTNAGKLSCDEITGYALHGNNSKQKIYTRSSQIFLSKSVSNYR